jgi:predicted PurR-regulated permease PerM
LNALLVVVGSFFLAADPTAYEREVLLLVPKSRREVFDQALADTAVTLRLWLRAKVVLMVSMGVMIGLGLWLAGVPSAFAMGLLAGISEFVPYVGPTVAMVPALGLALTGGPNAFGGAIATFVVVRLIEANLLTPFVQQRVVHIPPALTLFAIIGIGAVTGVYGLFFSGAIMVVVYSLLRNLYLPEVLGEEVEKEPEE